MGEKKDIKANGWALIPFLVFAAFYVGMSLYAGSCGVKMPWYAVKMPIAFLVASAVSLAMCRRKTLEERIDMFAFGMGETNIMMMCLIFILAGAFATVTKTSGAVDAAVDMALSVVPAKLMVAGVFIVSCLISTAIGTSCGTIAAVVPIALGVAGRLELAPALLVGAVVGGAMFGDNLSMISDTTIAATRTQNVRMKDKFFANVKIAMPAALVALVLYAVHATASANVSIPPIGWRDAVLVFPYVFVLVFALVGFNVMALLFSGTVLAAAIGIAFGKFTLLGSLSTIGSGLLNQDMCETMIVAILAGGLFRSIQTNGGILWLTNGVSRCIRGARSCEAGMAALVALVNCFTANNTVAIVIAGPVANDCSKRFGAEPVRIASVLDTVSCIVQGIIPYGAQVLIAIALSKGAVEFGSLVRYMYYQPLLLLAVVASMMLKSKKGNKPS